MYIICTYIYIYDYNLHIATQLHTSIRMYNVTLAYDTCFLKLGVNKGDNCRQLIQHIWQINHTLLP